MKLATTYLFAQFDSFEFEDDKLVIKPTTDGNIVFPYSKIKMIQLTGKEGRFYHPSMIIEMKDESRFKILGYGILTSRAKKNDFSNFVIELHQHLKPYKGTIDFTSGMSLPKPGILAIFCIGLMLIYNATRENPVLFATEKSLTSGLAFIAVSVLFMRNNGGTYDPEKIPSKLL